ncbi:MAG: UDP-N-acetylmuramate--L-alanine ligase, partial [Actinomycetota bacterium]
EDRLVDRGGGAQVSGFTWWTPPADSIPTSEIPRLDGVRGVHLIGIGGAGMRNLARLFHARGIQVTGSDLKASNHLRELEGSGVVIHVGHDPEHVGSPDAVVISSAIRDSNVELAEARRRSLPVWKRQQALGALAHGRRAIAVAGTHGKTTTTSMVAVALERGGLDPTYLIGGDLNESGSGARHGDGDLFVFEADESDGSFLLVPPWLGVITNIDVDHLDFFPGGREEIERAFAEFAARCEILVAFGDDPGARRSLELAGVSAVTYGFEPGNDTLVGVEHLGPDGARGTVQVQGGSPLPIDLRVDGRHNLLDAAAAITVATVAGIDPTMSVEALEGFEGVHRRFEFRGSVRGAAFFDDYGHNPAEMAVTVETARRRRPERLIALVQPHRYSRVQSLWRELGASVADADLVIVTDVYGAAQEPIPGVTGKLVVDGVQLAAPGRRTVYLPHRRDVVAFLDREVRAGDLIVTMGCGDVWMLGDAALEQIREHDGRNVA